MLLVITRSFGVCFLVFSLSVSQSLSVFCSVAQWRVFLQQLCLCCCCCRLCCFVVVVFVVVVVVVVVVAALLLLLLLLAAAGGGGGGGVVGGGGGVVVVVVVVVFKGPSHEHCKSKCSLRGLWALLGGKSCR